MISVDFLSLTTIFSTHTASHSLYGHPLGRFDRHFGLLRRHGNRNERLSGGLFAIGISGRVLVHGLVRGLVCLVVLCRDVGDIVGLLDKDGA